jgi:hypothetical protein
MGFESILGRSPSIIFQPGGVAGGQVVTSWTQVQKFITARAGNVIVYIDDSIAAAHVPVTSGVTDCQGRVEFRPFKQDLVNYKILVVDNGATLKNMYRIAGTLAIEGNTTGGVPAFDWDYPAAAPGPCLYIDEFAFLATGAAATQPACVIPAAGNLEILATGQGGISQSTATAVFNITAGGSLNIFLNDGSLDTLNTSWATGAGHVFVEYDSSSVAISGNGAVQPSAAAANTFFQLDTHTVDLIFNANTANILGAFQTGGRPILPTFGTLLLEVEGWGGSGGGGGGQAGGASNGVGGGASGGCLPQRSMCSHNLADRLDVIVGSGGIAGPGGVAPAGDGTDGGDGTRSLLFDFVTSVILAGIAGSSGGQGGKAATGPGRGGACYTGGVTSVHIPNIPAGGGVPYGSGFMLCGGEGGAANVVGTPGQAGVTSQLIPGLGANWQPGGGGTSGAGEGGGGGGGGAGILAPGGPGGNGAAAGSPGGDGGGAAPNSGGGVGGGAGGSGAADNGGNGATGALGRMRVRFSLP